MSANSIITIFGGSGFLGRRIVRALLAKGSRVRVATRHPDRAREVLAGDQSKTHFVRADVRDEASIAAALKGAVGAVNAVSLYVERGGQTFRGVHGAAAGWVARAAQQSGIARLVHVSGIGADAHSPSAYIRSRGEGERIAALSFPGVAIVRSAVLFGPDDVFLTTLTRITGRFPVVPLFGRGETRLQPAFVDDVGEAIARILTQPADPAPLYELAGPRIYAYRDLLNSIGSEFGRWPLLMPVPFHAWHALATIAEFLPRAPLTRNQVELMQIDNIAGSKPGFSDLGIAPRSIEEIMHESGLAR